MAANQAWGYASRAAFGVTPIEQCLESTRGVTGMIDAILCRSYNSAAAEVRVQGTASLLTTHETFRA